MKELKQDWLKIWKDYCSKKFLKWRPLRFEDVNGAIKRYQTIGTTSRFALSAGKIQFPHS